MAKDYYKILGVERGVGKDEIKRAFRKLAHEHHPDKGGDAAKFKEIVEAYGVLSDDAKRGQYDRFGTVFEQAGAGSGPGFGGFGGFPGFDASAFNDFPDLSDILGEMFGFGGRQGRRRGQSRGRDIEVDLEIRFEEAIFGAEKTVSLHKPAACSKCSGSGAGPGAKFRKCAACGGSGETQTAQRTMFGQFITRTVCFDCAGKGESPETVCAPCRGTGLVRRTEDMKLKIPAGVEDGGVMRVEGYGEAAGRGGIPGDLYVRIRVRAHQKFERHGNDIFSRDAVSFPVAALGGKVRIETVDGPVELKIPAGTQPGSLFRLRGKGAPYARRAGRGDHIVEITVEVPVKLSRRQKKLLEDFESE